MKVIREKINEELWWDLCHNSDTCTWFQTPSAFAFYQSISELIEPFVFAIQDQNQLRGVVLGYITKEKNRIKDMLTRRAIIIGGPLLAKDIADEELESLLRHVRSGLPSVIFIETRNFNNYSAWKGIFKQCGFNYNEHYNFKVDCSSEEIIMKNMDRGRKRNITSSIAAGCTMIEKPTIEQVRDWYVILRDLYEQKVKTPLFPLSFFEKLFEQDSCKYFLIQYEGKIIGGTACVVEPKKAVYEWFGCGRDGEVKGVAPSVLSTYQGMKYAADKEIPILDMMGAGSPKEDYGVRKFKERFGGELVEHGRFLCVKKPLLYKIGVLGVKILKKLK